MTRPYVTTKSNAGHIANEWADAAANGLQYLRNLRDGIGSVEDAIRAMELNVARIQDLPEEVEYQPTIEQAIADYTAATEALEKAEETLYQLVGSDMHPGGYYSFVKYDPRGTGLGIEYHCSDHGTEYVLLTKEDLQAENPSVACRDRLRAEREEKQRQQAVLASKQRSDALVAQLAAMSPEARAALLAKAEGKN